MNDFPLFRVYTDHQTWFKVHSPSSLTELKRLGNYYSISEFTAKIHPDRVMIDDLIHCQNNSIHASNEIEFEETLQKWSSELKKVVI